MAYDRMDWHQGSNDFPENIPYNNAGVHIGIFLAWCIENNLIGEFHLESEESREYIEKVKNREVTGTDFLIEMCDEKFWEEDLSEQGNEFAKDYYDDEENDFGKKYMDDFDEVFSDYDEYTVEDSWENYDKMKPILDKRFAEWKKFKKGNIFSKTETKEEDSEELQGVSFNADEETALDIWEKYRKKEIKQFPDLGFKLLIFEELLNQGLYGELSQMLDEHEDECIERDSSDEVDESFSDAKNISTKILDFVVNEEIPQDFLEKIENLCVDGGNEIYKIMYDWDGEDELFEVYSVEGFEKLKNLKTVELISGNEEVFEPMKKAGIKIEI